MELHEHAARQHGLITRSQAMGALGPSRLRRWLTNEPARLQRVHPGVYRVCGVPITWEQRLLAAQLWCGPGAFVSHRSAAALWDLFPATDVVELTLPRSTSGRRPGIVVHRQRDTVLPVRKDGMLVTNPLRTVIDLGAVVDEETVREAFHAGLTARYFSVRSMERALAAIARPGRNGSGPIGRILDERLLGEVAPDSVLEPRLLRLLRAAGLPDPVFQHWAGRYRLDAAYPAMHIAIEVDGWSSRATPQRLVTDLRRQNDLVLAGWTVLRFTWEDIVRRPERVAAAVRAALGAANAAPQHSLHPER